jgi:hypothetical protein
MAKASYVTTAIRPTSRPVRPVPAPDFFSVENKHIRFFLALRAEKPRRITNGYADSTELEDRAEHLERVLKLVTDYVGFILEDTADNAPCGAIDRKYLTGLLSDTAADVAGGIRSAAHETEA